jgi:signal recognition particle receptor subunit alpha
MDIVVVAVYQRVLSLPYVDELLQRCKSAFVGLLRDVAPAERDNIHPCASFTPKFNAMQAEMEQRAREANKQKSVKAPRAFSDSKKFANTRQGNRQSCAVGGAGASPSAASASPASSTSAAAAAGGEEDGEDLSQEQIAANIAKLKAGVPGPPRRKSSKLDKGGGAKDGGGEPAAEGKKGKEMRTWDGDKPGKQVLDYSKKDGGAPRKSKVFEGKKVDLNEAYGGAHNNAGRVVASAECWNSPGRGVGPRALLHSFAPRHCLYTLLTARSPFRLARSRFADLGGGEEEDDYDDVTDGAAGSGGSATAKSDGLWSKVKGSMATLVGKKLLERTDLDPLMEQLQSKLVEKNVATDIGGQICESVCSSLLGKQLGSFGSLRASVRAAMDSTLTRILTPSRRVDMLAAAAAARAEKRPYVIVFVGVNGVGKSTSLSKVAYYLKTNGFTPMLCACDTFRAGAVEQLRVHSQSLELPLFEKGYGRDASGIASDGIKYAAQMGHDVVLVDTAGRMQDNEPLMRSLSKLVTLNNPDLVLFVGEALVGNEAVDQVTGFNTALSEYSASREPRLIDGIMLTKFDTIDDKVGAALSLVYTTGKPIVFVGVGQTYTDIRNLNVEHCVRALLK